MQQRERIHLVQRADRLAEQYTAKGLAPFVDWEFAPHRSSIDTLTSLVL